MAWRKLTGQKVKFYLLCCFVCGSQWCGRCTFSFWKIWKKNQNLHSISHIELYDNINILKSSKSFNKIFQTETRFKKDRKSSWLNGWMHVFLEFLNHLHYWDCKTNAKPKTKKNDAGLPVCLAGPLQVDFLREGCGPDNICQSNLKMSYQFGTRLSSSDLFSPLPKSVSHRTRPAASQLTQT